MITDLSSLMCCTRHTQLWFISCSHAWTRQSHTTMTDLSASLQLNVSLVRFHKPAKADILLAKSIYSFITSPPGNRAKAWFVFTRQSLWVLDYHLSIVAWQSHTFGANLTQFLMRSHSIETAWSWEVCGHSKDTLGQVKVSHQLACSD